METASPSLSKRYTDAYVETDTAVRVSLQTRPCLRGHTYLYVICTVDFIRFLRSFSPPASLWRSRLFPRLRQREIHGRVSSRNGVTHHLSPSPPPSPSEKTVDSTPADFQPSRARTHRPSNPHSNLKIKKKKTVLLSRTAVYQQWFYFIAGSS